MAAYDYQALAAANQNTKLPEVPSPPKDVAQELAKTISFKEEGALVGRKERLARAETRLLKQSQKAERQKRTLFSRSKKTSKRRQKSTLKLLGALGIAGQGQQAGAGRPRGTYKYGMPIQKFKRLQAQRRALAQLRARQIQQQFAKQGYTPEQVVMAEIQSGQPQQIAQQVQQPVQQQNQAPINLMGEDPEVAFRRQLAQSSISPNTMAMLDRIKRIQNKGIVDDIEMQRRLNERRMVTEATNILKGRSLFHNAIDTIGLTKVDGNILQAPNIFRENPNNTHILSKRRFTMLDGDKTGTRIRFW